MLLILLLYVYIYIYIINIIFFLSHCKKLLCSPPPQYQIKIYKDILGPSISGPLRRSNDHCQSIRLLLQRSLAMAVSRF